MRGKSQRTRERSTGRAGSVDSVIDGVVTYARSQVVDPLRGAGRWVAWGLLGGLLVSLGTSFLLLGTLRLVQTEFSTLSAPESRLSWIPYFVVVVVGVIAVVVTLKKINRTELMSKPGEERGTSGRVIEEDLVMDGWTEIIRNLISMANYRGKNLSGEDIARLMELADFEKMEQIRQRVDDIVEDPTTAEALKPYYRQFCKRPCFHDGYLPTFNRPNVTLVDTEGQGVTGITKHGVVANGQEYPVDCIIFATGFEVGTGFSRRAGYDVTGRDGVRLGEKWKDGIKTFHGLHSVGFPNLLIMSNAQSAFTTNFPHAMDENARHMAYLLSTCRARGIELFEASAEAEAAWVEEIISLSRFSEAFQSECTPGYYNNEGQPNPLSKQNASYGKGPIPFFERMRAWREQDELQGLQCQ